MVRSFLPKFSSKFERRLLSLCKNNPDDDPGTKKWNKNAVQYLVKKLKKNLDVIDELEKAISLECSNTRCVPLPKASDNRLLVSHRRCLPQVIYCRLWRWPDLQSHHQIKAIATCNSNSEQGSEESICVNPYHYERKKPGTLEPVLVPCSRILPDLSTSFEDSDPSGGTKAIPSRIRLPTTITGATVRSILSADSPLQQASEEASMIMSQQLENNPNVQGNQEVYMSYERDPTHDNLAQQDDPGNGFEYMPIMTGDASQQYEQQQQQQQLYADPEPQIFLNDPQHQQQSMPAPASQLLPQAQQPQQSHMQQHMHHPLDQQQASVVMQQTTTQAQQLQQMQSIPHMRQSQQQQQQQQGRMQPQSQHIQQQQQQPLIQPSPPRHQQQYHTIPQQHQQQATHHGSQLRQNITSQTEIAHPYQFKQNKFAHLARVMHEQNVAGHQQSAGYSTYAARPYSYTQQPAPGSAPPPHLHSHPPQVHYSQQPQQQYSHSVPASGAENQQMRQGVHTTNAPGYAQVQQQQQAQFPSHPPPSYATIYPQQQSMSLTDPYTGQDQMQCDYQQQQQPIVMVPSQNYYEPVAGPSHTSTALDQRPMIDFQEVPYAEGEHWCAISYYEYDQRLGEKYQATHLTISIDGYTHPQCMDRFCIGGLSNVNRNEFTEWVRRRIGKGVKLTYVDSEVYVECLSDSSVFVSSPLMGMEDGKEHCEHVSKLTPGSSIKVFSNPQFSKYLSSAVMKGFEAVYKLTSYCTFRISFVKGWGRSYKRQTILNTPCWVEVQLNGPLQWIDKVLRQMKPPAGCGSTS